MKKILITGDAGRGKTTLANKLSKKLNIPHFSTDDFFWEIRYSKPRSVEESQKLLEQKIRENSWIIEGTTRRLIKLGLDEADKILFLKYKTIFHQVYYIIKRNLSRKDENLIKLIKLISHTINKRFGISKRNKETLEKILRPYKNKVIEINSFQEIDEFLNSNFHTLL